MQKISSLLLVIIAGNIFAGKNDKVAQGSMHAVIGKYNLVMLQENDKKEKTKASSYDLDMVAWQALRRKCDKLKQERDQALRLLQERTNEKQEQSSSSESSPNSVIAISPTNVGDEQQLSLPEEIYLATPEARRAQSPVQFPADSSYYYEWPGSGNILGRSPGMPIDFKTSYDVYYYSAHGDCP